MDSSSPFLSRTAPHLIRRLPTTPASLRLVGARLPGSPARSDRSFVGHRVVEDRGAVTWVAVMAGAQAVAAAAAPAPAPAA